MKALENSHLMAFGYPEKSWDPGISRDPVGALCCAIKQVHFEGSTLPAFQGHQVETCCLRVPWISDI